MFEKFIQLFLDKNLIAISLFINITFQIAKDLIPEEKKMQYLPINIQAAIYRTVILVYSFLICYSLNLIADEFLFNLQDMIMIACTSLGLYEIGLRNIFNKIREILKIQ
jgi:hypothetical protein